MLISEAFHTYASDVIAMKNQSAKTEENHYICMRMLIAHFGDIDITSLSFPMIRDWKIGLDKTRSSETVRNYVIKLRVVLAYCVAVGMNVISPDLIPVPQRKDKVPSFISERDVAKLIASVAAPVAGYATERRLRNSTIVSMLYASGLRVSELCALNRDDIQEQNSFTIVGKGGRARLCFFDNRTRCFLNSYLQMRKDESVALFVDTLRSRRITSNNVQELFRRAWKKAGLSAPVHPHTLRHSFATNLLKNNMNMRYVQTLLGHQSLQTTQMYTHVVDEDLRKVYQQYHTV